MNDFELLKQIIKKYIADYEKDNNEYEIVSKKIEQYDLLFNYEKQITVGNNPNSEEIYLLINEIYQDEPIANVLKFKRNYAGCTSDKGKQAVINTFLEKYNIAQKRTLQDLLYQRQMLANRLKIFKPNIEIAKEVIERIEHNIKIKIEDRTNRIGIQKVFEYAKNAGYINETEHVLLLNALHFYDEKINAESKKSDIAIKNFTRDWQELPNILLSAFPVYKTEEIPVYRIAPTNQKIATIHNQIKQSSKNEIIDILEYYREIMSVNEFNYILSTLLNDYASNMATYSDMLRDYEIYGHKDDRKEITQNFNDLLEKYLVIYTYYDEVNTIVLEEATDEETKREETTKKKLIFSTSAVDPTKARIIGDIEKNVPKEYYERVQELIKGFKEGSLKSEQTRIFNNHRTHRGLCELREDQVRILYRHIKDDIYCILGVAVKKSDIDRDMIDSMNSRIIPNVDDEHSLLVSIRQGERIQQEIESLVETKGRKGTR